MEGNGAKMDEIQQLGRRKFAYNARHLDGGHYVNYIFEAEPADIEKIQTKLSLNDNVYLQHYQRLG
jgi:small subunit ribosomal protein S6